MRNRVFWSWILFMIIASVIAVCATNLQAKEVKAQFGSPQLANRNLPGLAVRTVEEALALSDDQIDLTT
ncbi:MAG: hypothetical protein WCP87_02400, partial [Atribacterota bacterium]